MTADDRATFVMGVDGGNSKTDVALVDADGRLMAALRGPTISHQQVGLERGADRLLELVGAVRAAADLEPDGPLPVEAVYCLAGADSAGDIARLTAAFAARPLAQSGHVLNDAFAPVRAGARRDWGVAVICGAGVNAAGIAPDGRTAKLAALGAISGDWGGGGDVGLAGLGAAVRARDRRGPRTLLEHSVAAHFGLGRPFDVANALEHGRIGLERLAELSPVVFAAASLGDAVAIGIVDRLADELAVMASAIIRRLNLTRLDPDVVLAGGVIEGIDAAFESRVSKAINDVAPGARLTRLEAKPVTGAVLLALDRWLRDDPSRREPAADRVRQGLGAWRPA